MSKLPEIGKRYKNLGSNRSMEARDDDEDVCFFCYDVVELKRSIPESELIKERVLYMKTLFDSLLQYNK